MTSPSKIPIPDGIRPNKEFPPNIRYGAKIMHCLAEPNTPTQSTAASTTTSKTAIAIAAATTTTIPREQQLKVAAAKFLYYAKTVDNSLLCQSTDLVYQLYSGEGDANDQEVADFVRAFKQRNNLEEGNQSNNNSDDRVFPYTKKNCNTENSDSHGYPCSRWDGPWGYSGYGGMLERLDDPGLLESQQKAFNLEWSKNRKLDPHYEFMNLNGAVSYDSVRYLPALVEFLNKTANLRCTTGLEQRLREKGARPPRLLRVLRLRGDLLSRFNELKKKGDSMKLGMHYECAISYYRELMTLVSETYIGSSHVLNRIQNVLSNLSWCQHSLGLHKEAGKTATDSLIIMETELAYVRRAKYGQTIAEKQCKKESRTAKDLIANIQYLLSAQKDLGQVLYVRDRNRERTSRLIEHARAAMIEVLQLLENDKKLLLAKYPKMDWDYFVRKIRSTFY